MNGKWKRWALVVTLVCIAFSTVSAARPIVLKSPDGKIVVTVVPGTDGELQSSVLAHKESLISASSVGMDLGALGQLPSQGLRIQDVKRRKVNSTWVPVWGKRSIVPAR